MSWCSIYSEILTLFFMIYHFPKIFNRDFSVKQKSETLWKWDIFRKDKKFHNFLPFRPNISQFDSSWYLKNQRLTTRPTIHQLILSPGYPYPQTMRSQASICQYLNIQAFQLPISHIIIPKKTSNRHLFLPVIFSRLFRRHIFN